LSAGAIVAFWPHLVVFSSTLLSETFFGLLLLGFVGVTAASAKHDDRRLAVVAGLLGALCSLTNPIALLLPVVMAVPLFARHRRLFMAFALAFVLPVAAWSLRNAMLPPGPSTQDRAWTNLAQGSWPLYHAAYNDASREPLAREYLKSIEQDEVLLQKHPAAGLGALATRMAAEPKYYASWYLIQKPFLLWDWSVRIGWGDIYFLQTSNSPFDRNSTLRTMERVFKAMNPAFFAVSLALVVAISCIPLVRRRATLSMTLVATLFVYVTAIHMVFQAEPRYSVAYKPFEILLFVTALNWAWSFARSKQLRRPDAIPAPGSATATQ
jgi:hypothetical protein